MQLFPDQLEMVNGVINNMRKGDNAVLLRAETGAGKTVIAGDFMRRATLKGSSCWFVAPRRELIRQTSNTFKGMGIDHSFIAAGREYMPGRLSNIVSLQTIDKRLDTVMVWPKAALIDESHYDEKRVRKFIEAAKSKGTKIIGLTATPRWPSGEGFGELFDSMVEGLTMKQLMNIRRLNTYRYFPPVRKSDLSNIPLSADGDYAPATLDRIIMLDGQRIGDGVAAYKQNCRGKRTIVFGTSIRDCEEIKKDFTAAGIRAAVINSNVPDIQRVKIINAFADGALDALINCDLLVFGFDLSAQVGRSVPVQAMIDMQPSKSLSKQRQKWGRCLRIDDEPAIICDLAGNALEHGAPCDDHDFGLEAWKVKKERGNIERTISTRTCDSTWERSDKDPKPCFFVNKVTDKQCCGCGFTFPIKSREVDEVEGEIVEMDIEAFKEFQKKWKTAKRMEVGKARTKEDLIKIMKERGYKYGWVIQQAKLKGIRL